MLFASDTRVHSVDIDALASLGLKTIPKAPARLNYYDNKRGNADVQMHLHLNHNFSRVFAITATDNF